MYQHGSSNIESVSGNSEKKRHICAGVGNGGVKNKQWRHETNANNIGHKRAARLFARITRASIARAPRYQQHIANLTWRGNISNAQQQ